MKKNKTRKKQLFSAAIVLFVLVILVTVPRLFMNSNRLPSARQSSSLPSNQVTPTQIVTPVSIDTSDWITYTDWKYHFSVKVPPEFVPYRPGKGTLGKDPDPEG